MDKKTGKIKNEVNRNLQQRLQTYYDLLVKANEKKEEK